jgi:hypothetical protein
MKKIHSKLTEQLESTVNRITVFIPKVGKRISEAKLPELIAFFAEYGLVVSKK